MAQNIQNTKHLDSIQERIGSGMFIRVNQRLFPAKFGIAGPSVLTL